MLSGVYTALITPFLNGLDTRGIDSLVDFQTACGVSGVLAVGTTGESPTLSWVEHHEVTRRVALRARNKVDVVAGTGSNNTTEALEATRFAAESGATAVLLVDPYYNGPSSLEIRREYLAPVAAAFPELTIIPYVIPGRTGAQLLPQDLALLYGYHPNVSTVKEATGDFDNMKLTRQLCGNKFVILSGDDDKTFSMMENPEIKASGVISVISNVAPKALSDMAAAALVGNWEEARRVETALKPLFSIVVVTTMENSAKGLVKCRARNPLPIKTLMRVLGMPSGPCRRPLGLMTKKGLDAVLDAARKVAAESPWVFAPLESHFGVNVEDRLNDPKSWEGLAYEDY